METPENKLKTKLIQLQMTVSRTGKVLNTESSQAIERQQASLKTITTEIELLRGEVEAKKITDKESPEEIEKWVGDIDEKLSSAGESSSSKDEIQAKLPKLTITKFNGTFEDWTRFWNQFSETIDKTGIPNVTKFAYLRELLDANVRKTVEALPARAPLTSEGSSYQRGLLLPARAPLTSEGYTRAKAILEEKYGKRCEIIKAYTKQILELPVIPNVNII